MVVIYKEDHGLLVKRQCGDQPENLQPCRQHDNIVAMALTFKSVRQRKMVQECRDRSRSKKPIFSIFHECVINNCYLEHANIKFMSLNGKKQEENIGKKQKHFKIRNFSPK